MISVLPDVVNELGISSVQSTADKQESQLARSMKASLEDFAIACYMYQTGISYDTDQIRKEAESWKGRYTELRNLVFVNPFREAYDPLWIKICNAMGITNLVGNVKFE